MNHAIAFNSCTCNWVPCFTNILHQSTTNSAIGGLILYAMMSSHHQNAATVSAAAAVVTAPRNWTEHPVYERLTTQPLRDAFLAYARSQVDVGTTSRDGTPLPTLPTNYVNGYLQVPDNDPDFLHMPHMELKYGKPALFVALSRSFFPTKISKEEEQKTAAVLNLSLTAKVPTALEIVRMAALQTAVYKIIGDLAASKADCLIQNLTRQSRVLCDGVEATSVEMVRDEWHKNPTRELAEAMYSINYAPREDGSFAKIMYDIIGELKIWFSVGEAREWTARGEVPVPKTHSVSAIFHCKFRSRIRTGLEGKPPHGVVVKMSVAARKGRRKKRFIFEENVRGWKSAKHVEWEAKKW